MGLPIGSARSRLACKRTSSRLTAIRPKTSPPDDKSKIASFTLTIGAVGPAGPPGPTGATGATGPARPGRQGQRDLRDHLQADRHSCGSAHPHLYHNGGTNTSNLYVFNGSASTASVAVNFLDINGTNLVGVTIPGTASEPYPGETGATTTSLLTKHTRNLTWTMPQASPDPTTNVAYTIQVTSDQPIVVGANLLGGGFMPNQCSLLPK